MRKYTAKQRAVALAVAVLVIIAAWFVYNDKIGGKQSATSSSVMVKAEKTGTYNLGGLTVTVPAGAVPRDTQLKITTPISVDRSLAPLGATAVSFDLSFSGGIEPTKPLDISIPLKDSYLPKEVQADRALLYSTDSSGRQWLIPSAVSDGVLKAQLGHLSPKTLVYPDDNALQNLIGAVPARIGSRPDCQTSVKISAGTVQFTGDSVRWSNTDDNSPINACLSVDGNNAKLTIKNRANYILSVASTDGPVISTATNTAGDAMVASLASKMYPAQKTKAFLGRDTELSTVLPSANLPTTVELIADVNTYFAEIGWTSLKFLVGMVAGVSESDKVIKLADNVVGSVEVVDCVKSTVELSSGKDAKPLDVFNLVVSKCTEKVVTRLGALTANAPLWEQFWKRAFVIFNGVASAVNTVLTALEGVKLQLTNTLRIVVANKSAVPCLTVSQAQQILDKAFLTDDHKMGGNPLIGGRGTPAPRVKNVKCYKNWAAAATATGYEYFYFEQNRWNNTADGEYFVSCEWMKGVPVEIVELRGGYGNCPH